MATIEIDGRDASENLWVIQVEVPDKATANRMRRLHGQPPTREFMEVFIAERLRATMQVFADKELDETKLTEFLKKLLADYRPEPLALNEVEDASTPEDVAAGVFRMKVTGPAAERAAAVRDAAADVGEPGVDAADMLAEFRRRGADLADALSLWDEVVGSYGDKVAEYRGSNALVVYRAQVARLKALESERHATTVIVAKEWADRVDAADRHSRHLTQELEAMRRKHNQLLGKLQTVSAVQRDATLRDLRAELEPVVRAEVEERYRADFYKQLEGELRALLSPLAERLGFVKDDDDGSS